MSGLFDNARNYSFYTASLSNVLSSSQLTSTPQIPAAWVLAVAPHMYAMRLSRNFDIRNPRTYTKDIETDQSIDSETKGLAIRADGASANGLENLGFYAAAVVAGNLAGLSSETMNWLTGGYIASRVLYNYAYLAGTTEALGHARTGLWLVGVGHILTLFVKSGNALKDRAANLL